MLYKWRARTLKSGLHRLHISYYDLNGAPNTVVVEVVWEFEMGAVGPSALSEPTSSVVSMMGSNRAPGWRLPQLIGTPQGCDASRALLPHRDEKWYYRTPSPRGVRR